jgi:hypothetical protein
MRVIDTDPDLLRKSAEASLHAVEQTTVHIEAEIKGLIPPLMETLTPEGPYGYTIVPQVDPDGSVRLPVATTYDEIRQVYEMVRGHSALLSVEPMVEVRGHWYTFQENISRGRVRATGEGGANPVVGIFPSGTGKGITGELVWFWRPRESLGAGTDIKEAGDPWQFRLDVTAVHDAYLNALRTGDVEGIIAGLTDGVASSIRDYAADTGTLIALHSKDEHRSYFNSLFEKYEIRKVDLLTRIVQDWYTFAEVRIVASPREPTSGSRTLAFHTAEFFVVGKDGRFVARIGHGTDPA